MAGYIALFIVGLLFLSGLVYIFRLIIKVNKKGSAEGDPLLGQLEVEEAQQNLTSGKVGGILVYSIVFFGLIWFMFYREPLPTYQVSATEIYNEFAKDKKAAIAKYRGEYVAITGTYVGNEIIYGSPAVLLKTSAQTEFVQCNFEGSRAKQTEALSLGKDLSLTGRVLGKTHNLVIEKCSVANYSK